MNLPNKLSLTRMALIPVMVVLLLPGGMWWNLAAAAVYGVAAFTDFLDGHIARKQHIVTDLGKFLDPVADKLLNLSALIMLTAQGLCPAWLVVLILARELCVDGLRMVASGRGQVIAAGKLGKIKTVSQIVLILWLMIFRLPVGAFWLSSLCALWVAAITLWSGAGYLVKGKQFLKE